MVRDAGSKSRYVVFIQNGSAICRVFLACVSRGVPNLAKSPWIWRENRSEWSNENKKRSKGFSRIDFF